MKPFKLCPVCQVPVRWILHDGGNVYDCSNKECPICFSEYVWFKKGEINFYLEDGILLHYRFKIDEYHILLYYKDNGDTSFIQIYTSGTKKRTTYLPHFSINWNNLELLQQKIKTLLTFS